MSNSKVRPTSTGSSGDAEIGVTRRSYVDWSLIGTVALLTLVSLASVLPPFFRRDLASFWIFSTRQMVLIVCLSLALILLAALAHQMRYLHALRGEFELARTNERDRVERHTARLYALLNLNHVMAAQSSLQSVFDSVTRLCCDAFGCDQASLMLYDAQAGVLEVCAVNGKNVREGVLGARQPIGKGISGWVAEKREPLLISPSQEPVEGLEFLKKELSGAMVVPIILRDELVGVINVSTRSAQIEFNLDDVRALQAFAENVGAAIRHAEQAEWMRATIRRLRVNKEDYIQTGTQNAYPLHTAPHAAEPGTDT
jgi:putative methionine-R-sulfoxide reductase with GAF domain